MQDMPKLILKRLAPESWIYHLVLFVALAAFGYSTAYGAEVTSVNAKRRLVTINKGKVDGFVKNEEVCFFEVSGKQVGCGRVKRAKLYSASVRMSADLIKKINKSQTANLKEKAEAIGFVVPTFAFRMLLNPTIVSPIKFNQISYVTPAAEPTSLWESGETVKSAPITFSLEGDLMRYRVAMGVRGRSYRTVGARADYDIAADEFITTNETASAFGGYLDVTALRTASKTERQFTLAIGVDYDVSTVDVTGAKEKYDTQGKENIYKIKSTLSTISARVVAKLDWIFSSSILGLGLNIIIPTSSTQDLAVSAKDTENRALLPNPDDDIKQRLNHTTNTLGVETVLSYAIPF